jgi:hypothetical protein
MTSLVSGSEQWRRWKSEGVEGLVDRSSRPQSCPHQTSAVLEHQIAQLRRELKLSSARVGAVSALRRRRCTRCSFLIAEYRCYMDATPVYA